MLCPNTIRKNKQRKETFSGNESTFLGEESTFLGSNIPILHTIGGRAYPVRHYPIAVRLRTLAFGNMVAMIVDLVNIRATCASALPTHSRSSWGPHNILRHSMYCAQSSKWGLFGRNTRSAIQGTSSRCSLGVLSVVARCFEARYKRGKREGNLNKKHIFYFGVLRSFLGLSLVHPWLLTRMIKGRYKGRDS